ncbi:hypothetical protein [Bacteroides sp. 51]|uniref:hypothetical protein n=1 Tax=Bacteroides sp. 51 TaxID=2302938 RepID=UPI0013D55326|nr:hypothetical protein [Bacteroides sp. 51]NDV84886.1 hypothetical protein [Bacteroides sp. 51]
MLNSIYEARKIKILLESLKNQKKTLSVPDFTDLSLIPMLYDWFNEIEEERGGPSLCDSVSQRKKFCFIILRLYSPGTILFGIPMNGRVRATLANVFNVKSSSSVSDYSYDVVFLYKNYKDTRDVIDQIYNQIIERLTTLTPSEDSEFTLSD